VTDDALVPTGGSKVTKNVATVDVGVQLFTLQSAAHFAQVSPFSKTPLPQTAGRAVGVAAGVEVDVFVAVDCDTAVAVGVALGVGVDANVRVSVADGVGACGVDVAVGVSGNGVAVAGGAVTVSCGGVGVCCAEQPTSALKSAFVTSPALMTPLPLLSAAAQSGTGMEPQGPTGWALQRRTRATIAVNSLAWTTLLPLQSPTQPEATIGLGIARRTPAMSATVAAALAGKGVALRAFMIASPNMWCS